MSTKASTDSLFRGGCFNRNRRHSGGQARDGVQVVIEPHHLDVKFNAYVPKHSFLEGKGCLCLKRD